MGKKSKGKRVVVIEDNPANNIEVQLEGVDSQRYDEANALVLPSKKRKTVIKTVHEKGKGKILSRKQRKKLEKIVERREKKSSRADLVSELQNYQLSSETYKLLTPFIKVQTESMRSIPADFDPSAIIQNQVKHEKPVKSGWKRSGEILANKQKYLSWSRRFSGKDEKPVHDEKVLGFDESSAESDSDEASNSDAEMEPVHEAEVPGDDANGLVTLQKPVTPDQVAKEEEPVKPAEKTLATKETVRRKQLTEITKKVVHVARTDEINSARSKLPIIPEEQVIMEQITENLAVVLAGETGCGKTTQVPQFLYEAGYTTNGRLIGITEPRRVAAISMANRVAKELNLSDEEVSYQIRFEGNASSKTMIKFMTDGVLLKEMGQDFLLKKYSVICIDEAHERSLFTDILIGLLSRCVIVRKKRNDPLKLIVMSATMRVEDFLQNSMLFKKKPGFVHIPARQFPVQVHFSKVTPENYVKAALKKTVQIHKRLPPGGILVFVTGQQEVLALCKNLKRMFPAKQQESEDEPVVANPKWRSRRDKSSNVKLKSINLDETKPFPFESENLDSEEDNSDTESLEIEEDIANIEPLHVLPLYSMLPTHEQQKIFSPPPNGARLCVVSTNVAETSLTIPSIRYVVDTGKVKDKLWDKVTGVQTFSIKWCSKASAEQRTGRAGRLGPGHCYRLYSSAVYEHEFQQYSTPEIKARPVDDMVLLMKSMSIDNVHNFPYPTHPGEEQLTVAENTLYHLGALKFSKDSSEGGKRLSTITPLGETMAQFPIGPRFSKMLAMSFAYSLTQYLIIFSAAMTVQEVFLDSSDDKQASDFWIRTRRKWLGTGPTSLLGDAMILLKAVLGFEKDAGSLDFCKRAGLRYKAMVEIRKLRKQLTQNVNLLITDQEDIELDPNLLAPSEEHSTLIRQIILSGCPDRIARKATADEIGDAEDKQKMKYAYKCAELEELAFIHSNSALKRQQPPWIVYQEAFEHNGKILLRGVTAIEPEWILTLCATMCHVEKILKEPPPFYEESSDVLKCYVKATYGKQGWELPVTAIEHPSNVDKYRYFAQFLLEGRILTDLNKWREHLISLPATMTKSWAKLQPRTQTILQKLLAAKISSKKELLSMWSREPEYLLSEYLEWVAEKKHSEVKANWPPVN